MNINKETYKRVMKYAKAAETWKKDEYEDNEPKAGKVIDKNPKELSPIACAISSINGKLTLLNNSIDTLEESLESVIECQLAEKDMGVDDEMERTKSPLAGELENIDERLQRSINRINNLTHRLEC